MEQAYNTTEKILAAIETRHITPRPKWYFVVRNILLWIPGLVTTLLGAYAVSGVLYGVLHAHLSENRLYTTNLSHIESLAVIPLLWIGSLLIFSLISIAFLRRTNKGYRHPAKQLLSLSITSSIVIGILFYAATVSSLTGPGSLYRYPTQHQQQAIWNDPENGRISGIVTAIHGTEIEVADFHGTTWVVNINAIPSDELSLLKIGNAIRIVGQLTGSKAFVACRVLQWELFPNELAPHQAYAVPKSMISCTTLLSQLGQQ